ncbi:hypothetical protein N9A08_14820 [Arthrobacter koreensis]|uniref:Amino acid transporter n=1 Tax=Arthrobacter koreensis TaxID=199136 RepID=A0ABY6FRM9_9MICC|nr:hypothetical protein [Arthrobacter koreensis]UYB35868.1 hypothetical protein N9A08_14820 [Arthrobacter koreensis]
MAASQRAPHGPDYGNVPVIASAVIAGFVAVTTAVVSTGGAENELRWQLGLAAGCITFIVCLLTFLLMIIAGKPNPDSMGHGSGVNRRFGAVPRSEDKDPENPGRD